MPSAPAISRPSLGRTFIVAAWLLGLAASAEIGAGGFALVQRSRHNPPLTIQVPPPGLISVRPVCPRARTRRPSPPSIPLPPPPAPAPSAQKSAGRAAPASAARRSLRPGPLDLPKPTPVEEHQVATPESRLDALVAQARALRERGDMSTAITRLREALALSPKNPLLISEMAVTYEKMGLEDKSLEQWRLIFDMGESAGIYFQAADAKLKASDLAAQQPAGPASQPDKTADNLGEAAGFQPGSSLALVDLSTVEKPATSDGYKRFTLKIPVKRRPEYQDHRLGRDHPGLLL